MDISAARVIEEVDGVERDRRGGNVPTGSNGLADAEVERLVDTYSDLICRVSYTYLKSTHDAEDVCQTVLMRLLTIMGSGTRRFTNAEHEKAWIIRATINACKDVLKSAYRQRTVGLDGMDEGALEVIAGTVEDAAPDGGEGADEGAVLLRAVNALPLMYREAIYLYYYEGYSVREIAAVTGRREATVNAHLSRGRAKLREMLKGDAR